MVVLPSTVAGKLSRLADRLYKRHPGVSVLVVAGPYMYRAVPGAVRTENYLGWQTGPAALQQPGHATTASDGEAGA